MEISKTKGLNSSELKYIAILAMLIDHIAWAFIPLDTPLAQVMHFIGRITAPIMCFFLTEGFHYTRNFGRYLGRMGIFAVISHFAFSYFMSGQLIGYSVSSMISTLALCLVTLWLINKKELEVYWKLPLLVLVASLAQKCDWGANAVLFTVAFELARGNRKNQLLSFSAVALITYVLSGIDVLFKDPGYFLSTQIFRLGIFLSVPLLMLYNGERGGGKATKWIFYVFYPAHLFALGYIYFNY